MYHTEQENSTESQGQYGIHVGQEQQFQSFVYNQHKCSYISMPAQAHSFEYLSPHHQIESSISPLAPQSADRITANSQVRSLYNADLDDEVPLLEELGINLHQIVQKTLTVMNPMRETDAACLQDSDLAGPLIFVLAFGAFLLLSGKVHFGYIYGIAVLGCVAICVLVNLMANTQVSLPVVVTVSVLGYCLLPMVFLAGISIIVSLQGLPGIALTMLAIFWCAWSASKLLVTALAMHYQQPLVAYPCALFYTTLALLTIF